MKRTSFKAVALSVSLSALALPSHAFDLFGLFSKENTLNAMLEHVPADSLLVIAGNNNEQMNLQVGQWANNTGLNNFSGLDNLLKNMDSTAGNDLIAWLVKDYAEIYETDVTQVNKHYGIKSDGAYILYTDGLFPVFRAALANDQALPALLTKAAAETKYELKTEALGKGTVYTFPLIDEADARAKLTLGVMIYKKTLTISFFTDKDNQQAKLERFALANAGASSAKVRWQQDGKNYGLDEFLRGYIDFLSIANAIYSPEHKANQQLMALLPDHDKEEFKENINPQCQTDVINLVSQSPRYLFGSIRQQFNNKQVELDFKTILELTNPELKANLTKLRGHLPNYLTSNDRLVAGFGVGLDSHQLAQVATALWESFTKQEFTCPPLQKLQATVAEQNPSVIGMGTAMLQGMNGVSFGLFDININNESIAESSIDAIATISAKQAKVLASMATQFAPFLKGVEIPADGTPVNLKSATIPTDLYASIKNEHIVLYSGTEATKVAQSVIAEPVTANGVQALVLDYEKISDIYLATIELGVFNDQIECQNNYTNALFMRRLPLRLSAQSDFTDKGVQNRYNLTINLDKASGLAAPVTGSYKLAYLDYDCSWVTVGFETLTDDSNGEYYEMDDAGQCRTYEGTYKWSASNMTLAQEDSSYRYRDSCDSDWQDADADNFSCEIMTKDSNEFYCLSIDSTEESTLYRYIRQ